MNTAARVPAETLRPRLADGLAALAIAVEDDVLTKLLRYLDLLVTWNSAFNLSGIRDPEEMLSRHLLDSLSILSAIEGPRVLDIGTGAGLPGIPLAIARPDIAFHLLDANGKKMRFLFEVKTQLALTNVVLLHARAEDLPSATTFDTVVSRAVGTLAELQRLGAPRLEPHGQLLAMKSTPSADELAAVEPPYTVRRVTELSVPGITTPRTLVCIARLPGQDGNPA